MSDENTFEEEISMFLRRNFPQIQMHGGESSILEADEDSGRVQIALGGACSGCGISPMTVQAIKKRMPNQVEAVETVSVSTDGGMGASTTPSFTKDQDSDNSEEESDDHINAPF